MSLNRLPKSSVDSVDVGMLETLRLLFTTYDKMAGVRQLGERGWDQHAYEQG